MALEDLLIGPNPGNITAGNPPIPSDIQALMQALAIQPQLAKATPAPPPSQSPKAKLKRAIGSFTSDLLFTMGESLRAGAQYPGSRGTAAAAGAALQVPMILQQIRAAEEQRRQQAALEAQAAEEQARQLDFENLVKMKNLEFEARRVGVSESAEERALNAPPPTRSIDRLSPEGIAAEIELKQKAAALEPPDTRVIGHNLVNARTGAVIATFPEDTKADTRTLEKAHVDDRLAEAEQVKGSALSTAERIAVRNRAVSEYDRLKTDPSLMNARMTAIETARMIREDTLRDDYEKRIADDSVRAQSYEYIDSVRNSGPGADDLVVIYNFIKMQDPNAVREGELDLARQTQSLPDTWKRYVQRFTTGILLGKEAKKQMIATADNLYQTTIKPRMERVGREYADIAARRNLDPANIIRPTTTTPGVTGIKGDPLGIR